MTSRLVIERLENKCERLEFYREAIAIDLQQANSSIKVLQNRIDRMDRKRLEKQNDLMRHLSKVSGFSRPHNMKAMRLKAELSIGEVQRETGLSKSVIWRIENGKTKNPSWDALFKLILFYEDYEQDTLGTVCKLTEIRIAIKKAKEGFAYNL